MSKGKGYFYGLNEQAINSIAFLAFCKRPLLENGLVLGKPGVGMVFSAKIDTLNEKKPRNKRVNEQSAN